MRTLLGVLWAGPCLPEAACARVDPAWMVPRPGQTGVAAPRGGLSAFGGPSRLRGFS